MHIHAKYVCNRFILCDRFQRSLNMFRSIRRNDNKLINGGSTVYLYHGILVSEDNINGIYDNINSTTQYNKLLETF